MEQSEKVAGTEREVSATLASTADAVREEGRQIAETAKASALRAAEERKSQATGFIRDFSSAIHKGSADLRERGRSQSAQYLDMAADEIDRFCSRLEGRDIGDLIAEVESFARRRPGLLFGAALLAGFGMVRFAMSSRHRGAEEWRTGSASYEGRTVYSPPPGPMDEAAAYQHSTER